jgi:uncharacterized membrane protein
MIPRRAQELVILVVGVFTPLGVLAVNGSAFLMQHLPETRIILAFGALLSGLLLNSLAAYTGLRRARRHVPDLLHEYRWWIWSIVVLVVVGSAVVGAYFTYVGLEDASRLPNGTAVIASAFLLLFPFAITLVARRLDSGSRVDAGRGGKQRGARQRG